MHVATNFLAYALLASRVASAGQHCCRDLPGGYQIGDQVVARVTDESTTLLAGDVGVVLGPSSSTPSRHVAVRFVKTPRRKEKMLDALPHQIKRRLVEKYHCGEKACEVAPRDDEAEVKEKERREEEEKKRKKQKPESQKERKSYNWNWDWLTSASAEQVKSTCIIAVFLGGFAVYGACLGVQFVQSLLVQRRIRRKAREEAKEEEYYCSLCAEPYLNPVTMCCGHTVCEFCLRQWIIVSMNKQAEFRCPKGGACPGVPREMPPVNQELRRAVEKYYPGELLEKKRAEAKAKKAFQKRVATEHLVEEVDVAYLRHSSPNLVKLEEYHREGADVDARSQKFPEDSVLCVLLRCLHMGRANALECARFLADKGAQVGLAEKKALLPWWTKARNDDERREWEEIGAMDDEGSWEGLLAPALPGPHRVGDKVVCLKSILGRPPVQEGQVAYIVGLCDEEEAAGTPWQQRRLQLFVQPKPLHGDPFMALVAALSGPPSNGLVEATPSDIVLSDETLRNPYESGQEFAKRVACHCLRDGLDKACHRREHLSVESVRLCLKDGADASLGSRIFPQRSLLWLALNCWHLPSASVLRCAELLLEVLRCAELLSSEDGSDGAPRQEELGCLLAWWAEADEDCRDSWEALGQRLCGSRGAWVEAVAAAAEGGHTPGDLVVARYAQEWLSSQASAWKVAAGAVGRIVCSRTSDGDLELQGTAVTVKFPGCPPRTLRPTDFDLFDDMWWVKQPSAMANFVNLASPLQEVEPVRPTDSIAPWFPSEPLGHAEASEPSEPSDPDTAVAPSLPLQPNQLLTQLTEGLAAELGAGQAEPLRQIFAAAQEFASALEMEHMGPAIEPRGLAAFASTAYTAAATRRRRRRAEEEEEEEKGCHGDGVDALLAASRREDGIGSVPGGELAEGIMDFGDHCMEEAATAAGRFVRRLWQGR